MTQFKLPAIAPTPWWVERDRVMSGRDTIFRALPSDLQETDIAADNQKMRANLSLAAAAPELFTMLAAIHAGTVPDQEELEKLLTRAITPVLSEYWSDIRQP